MFVQLSHKLMGPSCLEVLCLAAEKAVDLSCVGRLKLESCSGVSGAAFISVPRHFFGFLTPLAEGLLFDF